MAAGFQSQDTVLGMQSVGRANTHNVQSGFRGQQRFDTVIGAGPKCPGQFIRGGIIYIAYGSQCANPFDLFGMAPGNPSATHDGKNWPHGAKLRFFSEGRKPGYANTWAAPVSFYAG
jgi:hypothetical protein